MNETDPLHPRSLTLGGRIIEVIGWLIVAFGVALIVTQIVQASLSIGGIVLSLFVAVAGGATVVVGRSISARVER